MNFYKIIIFTGLFFILIMLYSLYFFFQENNIVENNSTKIIAPQLEQASKNKEEFVETVIDVHEESINKVEPSIKTKNVEIKEDEDCVKGQIETVKKESFNQPIYDNGIARSSAKAFFLLQDAKSKLLEPDIVVKVRIWRNIRNDLWLEEEAAFNHQKSMIECEGVNRQGLESGYYSVEVDGGGYGLLKFKFLLKKNEKYTSTYIMPNYSKVIAVQFVDLDGRNVEYTRSQPIYKWEANAAPFSVYETKKYLVLQNPPYDRVRHGSGSGQALMRTHCDPIVDYVFRPENSNFYVRVFSGQKGIITYEYRLNEGLRDPFVFESKFDDQLNCLTIHLNEQPILQDKTRVYVIDKSINNESVGYNTTLAYGKLSPHEERFDNLKKGFNIELKDSKFPLQLEYIIGSNGIATKKGDGFLFQKNFELFQKENAIRVRFVDKKIFKSQWETISLEEGFVTNHEKKLFLKEFKVNFLLSPTFFEMAKDFSMITSEGSSFELLSSNKNLCFTSLFNSDGTFLEENLKKLNLAIKSNTTNSSFLPSGYTRGKGLFEVPLSINANEIISSVNHEIEISPIQKAIILRAVNNEGSGLPWVEASLVDSENLSKVFEIQSVLLEPSYKRYLINFFEETMLTMPEAIEKKDRDKLKLIFLKDDTLEYFLKNGSWYNTSAKGVSDSKGYLVLKSDELIPDKKYSLFIWCQSQDDLKPDKEISFIAQKGISDLGIIKIE